MSEHPVVCDPSYDLEPGDGIQVGSLAELHIFAGPAGEAISPDMSRGEEARWGGRLALRELVVPDHLYSIADIRLEVMGEPYARLLDARTRGRSFLKAANPGHQRNDPERLASRYVGFELT